MPRSHPEPQHYSSLRYGQLPRPEIDLLLVCKAIWTYRLEMLGSARPSNVHRSQVCQSKILPAIVNAPVYVSNHILPKDLKIPFFSTPP